MKLRVRWSGGGWESDHFEDRHDWIESEVKQLAEAAAGQEIEELELVGGTAEFHFFLERLMTHWDCWGDIDTTLEIMRALHDAYGCGDERAVLMAAVLDNDGNGDLEDLRCNVDNDDPDCSVWVIGSAGTMREARASARRQRYENLPDSIQRVMTQEMWEEVGEDERSIEDVDLGNGRYYAVDCRWDPSS